MNISERLKIHTSVNHQNLEKMVVTLIRILETKEDYIRLLGLFYSYFKGIEEVIEKHFLKADLPEGMDLRKSRHIAEDIATLHGHTPHKLNTVFLPEVNSRFAAFGALYVLEGSALGGVHIAAMISKKLPDIPFAFRFFNGYGDQIRYKWEQFKNIIDQLSVEEIEIYMILSAADKTFNKFGEWIQHTRITPVLT